VNIACRTVSDTGSFIRRWWVAEACGCYGNDDGERPVSARALDEPPRAAHDRGAQQRRLAGPDGHNSEPAQCSPCPLFKA
jgi:hypothetical protein